MRWLRLLDKSRKRRQEPLKPDFSSAADPDVAELTESMGSPDGPKETASEQGSPPPVDERVPSVTVSLDQAFFYLHIYPSFTRKRCIAMFWTGRPHSLGSCHFRVTCLPHKGGASR